MRVGLVLDDVEIVVEDIELVDIGFRTQHIELWTILNKKENSSETDNNE